MGPGAVCRRVGRVCRRVLSFQRLSGPRIILGEALDYSAPRE